MFRLVASLSERALVIFLPRMLGTVCAIGGLLLQHGGENVRAWMRRGCGGLGRPQCAPHAAIKRSESAGARAETLRGHAEGATGPIVDPPTARGAHGAATDPMSGTKPQPGRTMLVRRPRAPIEAHCGKDGVDREGLSARHVREGDPGEPGQRGAESKRGCVALGLPMGGRRWGSGGFVGIDQGRKGAEDALDCLSAGRARLLGKIRACEGLGAREDLCRPVISLQRFGHGCWTGWDARVPRRRSGARSALPSDHSAEKAPARHACHIAHPVVEREMHVIQRLVHGLNRFDRHRDQRLPMAEETAAPADVLRRTQRRRHQPITLQPLPPSTIEAICCRASRHVLDVAGIDQGDCKPAGLKHLKQRNPVHPCRFHDNGGDATGGQPIGQTREVTRQGAQFLDRLGIAIGGDADPMLLSPHIDAGGMRMDHGHHLGRGRILLAFFRHTFLQSGAERGEHEKTGRLLSKDTIVGGARRVPILFHLD